MGCISTFRVNPFSCHTAIVGDYFCLASGFGVGSPVLSTCCGPCDDEQFVLTANQHGVLLVGQVP